MASRPVTVGPDLTFNGGFTDVFVAKVNAAGTALLYCGYIGGLDAETGWGIAVDTQGNAYVTGLTPSTEDTFPVTVGPDLTFNGGTEDAFVAKINSTGSALEYCGYIGGDHGDYGYGIAVDALGNAYVTGGTISDEDSFPVTVGPDLTYNGSSDAYVAKVNANGTALDYCGYIGGHAIEYAKAIAVDAQGNAYVTGSTGSLENTFPVFLGPDLTYNGDHYDAFVAKINSTGSALEYCGYIGGDHGDYGYGIAVDAQGNAYVTGTTSSTEGSFPLTVGPGLTRNGSTGAFVAKIGNLHRFVESVHVNGNPVSEGCSITIDGFVLGDAIKLRIVARNTEAQPSPPLYNNITVSFPSYTGRAALNRVELDPAYTSSDLNYSEYFGSVVKGDGYADYVMVESASTDTWDVNEGEYVELYVEPDHYGTFVIQYRAAASSQSSWTSGWSYEPESSAVTDCLGFPTYSINVILQAPIPGENPAQGMLVYSGYIGGAGSESGNGIAVDALGNAYVVGSTASDEFSFPLTAGPDLTYNGEYYDAFVAKINATGTGLVYCTYIGGLCTDGGSAIAVDAQGNAYITGITYSDYLSFPITVGPEIGPLYDCDNDHTLVFVAKLDADGTGLSYCRYLFGQNNLSCCDVPGIAVDDQGNAYIVGDIGLLGGDNNLPTTVGPDLTYNGGTWNPFVVKVNADGTAIDYCGYVGSGKPGDIAVDRQGNAYVTWNNGLSRYFQGNIAKINADGTAFDYTRESIGGKGIAVDVYGNAYATGDGRVSKINADGTSVVYTMSQISGSAIAVDRHGSAYVTGSAEDGLPTYVGPDLIFNGDRDAFVAKINPDGTALKYCGYIGGDQYDVGLDIAVDARGNAYITGRTESTEDSFPVIVGPDLTFNGGTYDAFVAKIRYVPPLTLRPWIFGTLRLLLLPEDFE
ncbi:MAG: SBBP repeat-containing protein [Deltaproteobacteria bacterium]|nr:SBBP repeat-containing protein [Deltaproteobacteria bacterium]